MSEDSTIPLKLVLTRLYNSLRDWILDDINQIIGKTIVGGKLVGGQISGKIPSTSIPNTAVTAGSYGDGTHVGAFTVGQDGRLTAASNVSITHQGTVTSVGLSMPSDFTVGGSPVTSSGTLAVTANSQSANTVKAGPASGLAAAPTYRALVNADIPSPLTISGEITGSDLVPSGLTGATAASRHVGATTSGAPVSGTFLKGDWVGDQTGKRWTCTVAGSPGTWVQEPGTSGGSVPTQGCRVRNSVGISIPNNTLTSVTFDTNLWDTDSIHSTVTNTSRLTAKTAGKYYVWAVFRWPTTNCNYQTAILLNATTYIGTNSLPTGSTLQANDLQVDSVWDMALNDYVEFQVLQRSGGSMSLGAAADYALEAAMVRML